MQIVCRSQWQSDSIKTQTEKNEEVAFFPYSCFRWYNCTRCSPFLLLLFSFDPPPSTANIHEFYDPLRLGSQQNLCLINTSDKMNDTINELNTQNSQAVMKTIGKESGALGEWEGENLNKKWSLSYLMHKNQIKERKAEPSAGSSSHRKINSLLFAFYSIFRALCVSDVKQYENFAS